MKEIVKAALDVGYEVGMHQHREELEQFLEFALVHNGGAFKNVLEIGMLHGGTAAAFHELSTGFVMSVDLPEGTFGGRDHQYNIDKCIERNRVLKQQFPRLKPILGDSQKFMTVARVSEIIGDEEIDLLFIDGDHSLEAVHSDFRAYSQVVREGGVIAFHDVAITAFHEEHGVQVPVFFEALLKYQVKHRFIKSGQPWGGIGAVIKGQEIP